MNIKSIILGGKEYLPLIEGGKGIAVSSGQSSGAWAHEGGIGTFSAVNADFYDEDGQIMSTKYKGKNRSEKHKELIVNSINGGIEQAKIAYETAKNKGRIHMNVLWEMGGCEEILKGVLSKVQGIVKGVTCGAGMPYRLSEICASHKVEYLPIVSSARAFNALWRRAYKKFPEWLGAVVYEDPWLAGGHNGLSNGEDPNKPQLPFARVLELRKLMTNLGLATVPIIIAGGVWCLSEWQGWLDNKELGPVAFQFGTRPLLTKESPISMSWKQRLLQLKKGDVKLHKFSPTGFYSSAVINPFLQNLIQRSERQFSYSRESTDSLNIPYEIGVRKRLIYVRSESIEQIKNWQAQGFSELMYTPDNTIVMVTPDEKANIHQDQLDCVGCLSACQFSNWSQHDVKGTGKKPDPRSFCIQKTLQDIAHDGSIEENLMFAGHQAYRFAQDPLYKEGNIPTVKELIDKIKIGQ